MYTKVLLCFLETRVDHATTTIDYNTDRERETELPGVYIHTQILNSGGVRVVMF